jgi:hypothetical protein
MIEVAALHLFNGRRQKTDVRSQITEKNFYSICPALCSLPSALSALHLALYSMHSAFSATRSIKTAISSDKKLSALSLPL